MHGIVFESGFVRTFAERLRTHRTAPVMNTHTVTLNKVVIQTIGLACFQCKDVTDELHVFYSQGNGPRRYHRGAFCSQECHDRFHQLISRRAVMG